MNEPIFNYRPPNIILEEVNLIFPWLGKEYKIKKIPFEMKKFKPNSSEESLTSSK